MADAVMASSLQDAVHKTLLLYLEGSGSHSLSEVHNALSRAGFDVADIRGGIDALAAMKLVEISVSGGPSPLVEVRLGDGAGVAAYDLAERSKSAPAFYPEPALQAEGKLDPTEP
jgi:hypothetical protein